MELGDLSRSSDLPMFGVNAVGCWVLRRCYSSAAKYGESMSRRSEAGAHPRRERRMHARQLRPYRISYFATSGDDAHQWQRMSVIDLSPGGIGIMSDRLFEMGARLILCFAGKGEATSLLAAVRVVRTDVVASGGWFLGCRFVSELGVAEFAQILDRTSPDAG